MDEENVPQQLPYELDLRMASDTPVRGVKIKPYVVAMVKARNFLEANPQFKIPPLTVAKIGDQFVFKANPQPPIIFSWFRRKLPTCSVHPSIMATVQCISCVELNTKVKSYHCSAQCFSSDWERHKICHRHLRNQQEFLRRSGSWPQSLDEIPELEGDEWIQVASSGTYEPSYDDINSLLMLECVAIDPENRNRLSLVQRRVITNPVIPFPVCSPRRMIDIECNDDGSSFSVLSYNILADILAKNHLCCPTWALEWEYRKQKLLKEINEYDADIICLQEVQENHYKDFFEPELRSRGYSALYKKKTNINELYSAEGYIYEGCAIFYRRDKFEVNMKEEHSVAIVVVLGLKNGSTGCNHQSRICLLVLFKTSKAFPYMVMLGVMAPLVATLIHKLQAIAQSQNIPILICGDLNSIPGSDPHRLIKQGINYGEGRGDTRPVINLESAYERFLSSSGIEHRYLLATMHPLNREPRFTYFTPRYSGTLDYIFYTADGRLKVVGLLELPSKRSLGGPLPSPDWPSDHIALMARFRLVMDCHLINMDHQVRRRTNYISITGS
ncbi:hypothetical protein SLEP1_g58581 [Rubroshorea leprosula]|uniref:Endonuclease/exonuclease/phosphatase domain-containing protein n=1 Tax=Rubroshorea leprosula TaxID=152421 RepID=A0AAV5MPW9_9ROSI|nr:hypothetical protein SLEP1_g58581 [Rubroshorea leprosula]